MIEDFKHQTEEQKKEKNFDEKKNDDPGAPHHKDVYYKGDSWNTFL